MTDRLRIALSQLNPKVGAIRDNLELARCALRDAETAGADMLMYSELFLSGYFPDDLLMHRQFIDEVMDAARTLAVETKGLSVEVILPTAWYEDGHLRNAALHLRNGEIVGKTFKHVLPRNDVFYEERYFDSGPLPHPFVVKGVRIGVPICEDIWRGPVCIALAERHAEILLCPNGSPYWRDKQHVRWELVRARMVETGLPILYLNQVGGQDELVFDGASFGMEPDRDLIFQAKSFEPDFIITDWARKEDGWRCETGPDVDLPSVDAAPWRACVLGLRDYIRKNGFKQVVMGLSGGIDSAITAAIAVDALGPENVHCVMLPYRYTSSDSLRDAEDCARRLGVRYDIIPIGEPVEAVNGVMGDIFAGLPAGITEENIQSRMRGLILMALSNKLGSMLVTTGNKSEMAVGYATIYGDMNGGFNPIKDMWKTQVYHLADWRNSHVPEDALGPGGEVIPAAIINKAPSAELREDQKDQDSLPPYDVLDAILQGLVEDEASVADIVARGLDRELVKKIERMLYLSEHKRWQAAPGVKVTVRAFGGGRRFPITMGWRDQSGQPPGALGAK